MMKCQGIEGYNEGLHDALWAIIKQGSSVINTS